MDSSAPADEPALPSWPNSPEMATTMLSVGVMTFTSFSSTHCAVGHGAPLIDAPSPPLIPPSSTPLAADTLDFRRGASKLTLVCPLEGRSASFEARTNYDRLDD